MASQDSAQREIGIRFEGLSAAEANKAAIDLENALLDLGLPDVTTKLQKDRQNTQDFGATLLLLLGSGASLALAKGIADWLRRRADAASLIIIDMGENRVIARGVAAKEFDAAGVANALAKASARRSGG
jgi:hypothetical protein